MPGIYKQGKGWAVACTPNGMKKVHVGVFATEELACRTYDKCMLLLERPCMYYREGDMLAADLHDVQTIAQVIPANEMVRRLDRLRLSVGVRPYTPRRQEAHGRMGAILQRMCRTAISRGECPCDEELGRYLVELTRALMKRAPK
jgi:hypothetical protein